jgi:hypothetical protein
MASAHLCLACAVESKKKPPPPDLEPTVTIRTGRTFARLNPGHGSGRQQPLFNVVPWTGGLAAMDSVYELLTYSIDFSIQK